MWTPLWVNQSSAGDFTEADLILTRDDGLTKRYSVHFQTTDNDQASFDSYSALFISKADAEVAQDAFWGTLSDTVAGIDPIDDDVMSRTVVLCQELGVDVNYVIPILRSGCQQALLDALKQAPRV